MSVDHVRQLGTEALCQWLNTQLDEEERKDAESVIRQQKIKGKNFLVITDEKWMSVGLTLGVATSLVQIAQAVLETEKKTPESKPPVAVGICILF